MKRRLSEAQKGQLIKDVEWIAIITTLDIRSKEMWMQMKVTIKRLKNTMQLFRYLSVHVQFHPSVASRTEIIV